MTTRKDAIVEVRDAHKKFGSKCRVLNGFNMTVNRGTIYGLLGPSGCGKTTLLLSIMGASTLDSGEIILKGPRLRSDVGYMPQEISLFLEFSILETCSFYGCLYNMDRDECAERAVKLIEFLDLPSPHRLIRTLSGGQKRRVSLAVTLIHKPQLLILDEPTVGMDCLLGQRIWDHLINLSKQGTTIIITTHYIQEAVQSNTVGMMRGGQLLMEESPQSLMARHNTTNLEEIFLEYSCKQEKEYTTIASPPAVKKSKNKRPVFASEGLFRFSRFYAQLYKNLCWFRRNLGITLAILIYPLIVSILFAEVTQEPVGMKIGVTSDELIRDPCGNRTIHNFPDLNCSLPYPFSCLLIEHLSRKLDVKLYTDQEAAQHDLLKNRIWARVHVRQNFSESLIGRLVNGQNSHDSEIELSMTESYIDNANFVLENYVRKFITLNHLSFYHEILSQCGISPDVIKLPLRFNEPIYGVANPQFGPAATPGLFSAFGFYYALIYTAATVMWEKTQGLVKRNSLAGMTYIEVVLAHLTCQFFILLVQDVSVLANLAYVFEETMKLNVWTTMILIFCTNGIGVSFAFLLTEMFQSEMMVIYSAITACVVVFTLGGVLWPQEGVFHMIDYTKRLAPSSSLTRSLAGSIFKDFDLSHPHVYLGVLSNVGWVAFFAIATGVLFKLNKRLS